MKNSVKAIGGLLAAAAIIIYKFDLLVSKLGMLAKYTAFITAVMHLSSQKDSTALASRPQMKKPQRVAQANSPKPNLAEKVAGPSAPAPSGGPALMPANPLSAGPIQAARNAAAAQNAQLAKETGQEVPPPKGAQPNAAQPPAPAPSQAAQAQNAQVVQQGAPKPATNVAAAPNARSANSNVDAPVMRESFDYVRESRRDPFVSLMTTSDLRPTLSDLRLTGILYDLSGRRPVAILRDIAGGQWRVTTGMTLGRMRVAQIRPKTIIFTIEEFGFNRQDSLLLGDTTRVRHR